MFVIDSATAPLFAGTDTAAPGAKLTAAIGFVAGALRQPDAMPGTARAPAAWHVGHGGADAREASVGGALLWMIEEGFGSDCTPAVRGAWAATHASLGDVTLEAAHAAHDAMQGRMAARPAGPARAAG